MVLKRDLSERDQKIFWLYYRLGFSAKQIAEFPTFQLTAKGVESTLHRLTVLVRARVSPDIEKGLFGKR